MTAFTDDTGAQRFHQTEPDAQGTERPVWADYAVQGGTRIILHVEADEALRGTGAAGRFMQALADHARAEGLKLTPRCSYAVAWHKRHKAYDDVLA
jgi:uncharacterized protein